MREFSMNIKMISPQEVIASAIQEWEKRPNEIEYQLEGFVRQIIGWREYMRIYWLKMPDYASMNFSIIKKSYQNGFGPENQNALFKGYYKSVLKLWICTSYSAINDNRELCAFSRY
jgi:hypothetical protein